MVDPGIALAVGFVVLVVGVIVVWRILERRLPRQTVDSLLQVAADVSAALAGIVDRELVIELAGWAYDQMVGDGSQYYSREEWIALVVKAWYRQQVDANVVQMRVAKIMAAMATQ